MSRIIECFLIEPTDRFRVYLRRYRGSAEGPCPAGKGWYHNASVFIALEQHTQAEHPGSGDHPEKIPHDDARWPVKCDRCDYAFVPEDNWQMFYERMWRTADGREFTLVEKYSMHLDAQALGAPPGAMWRATWMEPFETGPDGHSYVVRTPGGDWHIDGPATGGGKWTRTGVAPKLTARPSILCGKREDGSWTYHGFLTDGRLEEC